MTLEQEEGQVQTPEEVEVLETQLRAEELSLELLRTVTKE